MTIDLSQYPAPSVLESLTYENILSEIQGLFIAEFPADATEAATQGVPTQFEIGQLLQVEGNLVVKALQAYAYHALQLRARINDAAKATMLAYATGTDLDNLAAFYGVTRNAGETDDALRTRITLAVDGFSVAGPINAYKFHGLSADGNVKDIGVESPTPGTVQITVLSKVGDGVPDAALINTVGAALNADDVRPLTDTVTVQGATIVNYTIDATLYLYGNVDSSIVVAAAQAAAQSYADATHKLGYDITISGLHQALHQPGVQRVELNNPTATIARAANEAGFCTGITVTFGGVDA